jgi:hypothetical protein
MKRLILIVLVCAPMMMMAQGRDGGATKPGAQGTSEVDMTGNRFIYAEIVLTTGAGTASARVEFGSNFKDILADKEAVVKMEALKAKRYTSAVDAINALNSEGFKVVTSFTTTTRQGSEAHIIMEKPNLPQGSTQPVRSTRGGK